MLRIIGGSLRGRKLKTLSGQQTRPTLEKTRGVIFNTLQSRYYLEEFQGYDLFAGSGALGLEAHSRGVPKVTFVEKSRDSYSLLAENLRQITQTGSCTCINRDAIGWLKKQTWNHQLNLFLLDPPYQTTLLQEILELLHKQKEQLKGSLIILETDRDLELEIPPDFKRFQQKYLSKTRLDFLEIQ
ncbi:MAG: 16S rRNA (guanine(966)-N(2))-methyltransferase RsmD [SAR324 cluster bacterium]|uniref:16S rRNA (Guanine(966)-N(2))-methyltransferase RsmD n=1 Tax=SAR324 cluster bacterium TaxID=2024889 RepID=A0A2A4T2B9_9DELT|nr:MAG: 16S rRNA (guanine(966)-N(2))-methyltransferase RsmD [SAR324 cluster bacterium]